MLRGGFLIIHLLSNVAGSAADRSTLFLLNGIVGDGPRALHAEPGGMTADFSKQKMNLKIEDRPRVYSGGHLIIHLLANEAGSAADRPTFLLPTGVVGDGPRVHSTSTSRRAGRDDCRLF